MHVNRLALHGVTKHKNTSLSLPDAGVVAVTGANGSGKSSIIEGVALAGWGESLRGATLWAGDGGVELFSPEVAVARVRKGGKTTLLWTDRPDMVGVKEFETTTKAQEALEAIIGSFNVWRRTCVFSSQDAAHFTQSTDGERKRLLEALLNLSRFDEGLERCRAARKAAADNHLKLSGTLATLKSRLEVERLRVRDADRVIYSLPLKVDVADVKAQLVRVQKAMADIEQEMAVLVRAQREADREVAVLESGAMEARRRLRALDAQNCDRCGQPIPEALVQKLTAEVRAAEAQVAAVKEKADAVRADRQQLVDELGVERNDFYTKQAALNATVVSAGTVERQWATAQEALASAKTAVAELEARITKGESMVDDAARELAVLEAVEIVLGLKGVRAHVLGKTLSGLEAVANSWLARIAGPGLTLSMKPYSEKKTGGVSDAIALDITGAGGGFGYKASSGGERRRIDVALLLALAEVAQAAHGRGAGSTLFFDECMDSLDRDGIVAVSEALRDLAKDRCVVVITHDPDLLEQLHPAVHLRATDGELHTA